MHSRMYLQRLESIAPKFSRGLDLRKLWLHPSSRPFPLVCVLLVFVHGPQQLLGHTASQDY